jgi:hypothetical protein
MPYGEGLTVEEGLQLGCAARFASRRSCGRFACAGRLWQHPQKSKSAPHPLWQPVLSYLKHTPQSLHNIKNMVRLLVESVSSGPHLRNSDWQSAERFWDMRDSWSFFQKLRQAFRIDQAFLKSRHWLTSPQELQYRKYILSQAITNVKKFRRQITRGDLSFEEINKRIPSVYGAYA